MHKGPGNRIDRGNWMDGDLEWERQGQRGGLVQGRGNLEGRLPPRHIPPNHTKPNPKTRHGQPGRGRAHLRSCAKELPVDDERM